MSSSDEDTDTGPLLGRAGRPADLEHGPRLPWRRVRYTLCHRRWPVILIALGLMAFLGLSSQVASVAESYVYTGGRRPTVSREDIEAAAQLRVLASLMKERYPEETGDKLPRASNYVALDRLSSCLLDNTCNESERRVVLLSSFHFGHSELGHNGGEQVWARSMIAAFRQMNITTLFTWGHMDTLLVYQQIPNDVTHILWERSSFKYCESRNETNYQELDKADWQNQKWHDWQKGTKACMQSERYPQGIPYWKSFLFWFFVETDHPLGPRFVLAPEPYDDWYGGKVNHTYIGYSIEHRCKMFPTFEKREHRGLILAKRHDVWSEKVNGFYGIVGKARDGVRALATGEKFELVTTVGEKGDKIVDPPIESLGKMDQKQWTEILARSKLLLGVGRPIVSPSPYYALCMGVPFIQPVGNWAKHDPDNRLAWHTQQMGLRMMEEPYVYHVKAGDEQGLRDAMQRAIDNPIPNYLPPQMAWDPFYERVKALLANDWQAEGRDYIRWKYNNAPEWQYLVMDG